MLNYPTLGLPGMAKAFGKIQASAEAAALTHPKWLALLLDREVSYRRDRRLLARLRYAKLRHQASIEDVDTAPPAVSIALERSGRQSTIITSQIPVDKWQELIGERTYADAILDRIVHKAHRINLTGHSLRRSRTNKPAKD